MHVVQLLNGNVHADLTTNWQAVYGQALSGLDLEYRYHMQQGLVGVLSSSQFTA